MNSTLEAFRFEGPAKETLQFSLHVSATVQNMNLNLAEACTHQQEGSA